MNYADLCDLDLTPIEERRKHDKCDNKLLSRAARYNILLEKRGLTTSDAESSSKESCYSSDYNNEMVTESYDRSSDSNSEYEELHDSIDDDYYCIDDDNLQSPFKKKIKITENGLDQPSDADRTLEIAEHIYNTLQQ